MKIFGQEQTHNGSLEDESDSVYFGYSDYSDNHCKDPCNASPYVLAALSLAEANKEDLPTFQQILETQHLDREYRQVMKVVYKPPSIFSVDTNGLLIRVTPLHREAQIYVIAAYRPVISTYVTTRQRQAIHGKGMCTTQYAPNITDVTWKAGCTGRSRTANRSHVVDHKKRKLNLGGFRRQNH